MTAKPIAVSLEWNTIQNLNTIRALKMSRILNPAGQEQLNKRLRIVREEIKAWQLEAHKAGERFPYLREVYQALADKLIDALEKTNE